MSDPPTGAPSRIRVAAVTAALLAFAAVIAILIPGSPPSTTVTRSLGGVGPTATVTTTKPALAAVVKSAGDNHGRNETPTGVAGKALAAGRAQQTKFAARDNLPTVVPLATPQTPGCRSRMVRNYSSRNGIKPRLFILHLTVSPDQGQTGVNAITQYFDQSSSQVSAQYVVSGNGDCNYIVPEQMKSWAVAGFNSAAISVEVTATQTQGYYVHSGGIHRLAVLIAGAHRRWGIPFRRGAVSGCSVVAAGITDHQSLGACGGGHDDISPYRTMIATIIHAARVEYSRTTVTARRCRELTSIRRSSTNHRWTAAKVARAQALKKALGAKAATCH